MWHVRRYQGLSKAELDLAQLQFEACDEDGSGGMACCELEFAIRSLGFFVTYEEVQEQLDQWDLDESGEIEFVEFLKVVAHYKKKDSLIASREVIALGTITLALKLRAAFVCSKRPSQVVPERDRSCNRSCTPCSMGSCPYAVDDVFPRPLARGSTR